MEVHWVVGKEEKNMGAQQCGTKHLMMLFIRSYVWPGTSRNMKKLRGKTTGLDGAKWCRKNAACLHHEQLRVAFLGGRSYALKHQKVTPQRNVFVYTANLSYEKRQVP